MFSTRKFRRNQAKAAARIEGKKLTEVWPAFRVGKYHDPKVRPRRSIKALEREWRGEEKVFMFLCRLSRRRA